MTPKLQFHVHQTPTSLLLEHVLQQVAGLESQPRCLVVADLTLSSWTTQSLARQMLGQLTGKELRPKRQPRSPDHGLGDSMSAGVDEEGRGSHILRLVHKLATQITRTIGSQPGEMVEMVLLVPCLGTYWRTEDKLLLEYLHATSPRLRVHLAVVDPESVRWPAEWQVSIRETTSDVPTQATSKQMKSGPPTQPDCWSLLPCSLSPGMRERLPDEVAGRLLPLANGWSLIPPEDRREAVLRTPWFDHEDLLRLRSSGLQEFAAFAALHSLHADSYPAVLHHEAWTQFGGGARELAILYMEAAARGAKTVTERAVMNAHRQVIQIAMAQYSEVAQSPDPSLELAAEDRRLLLETKGWALVMQGTREASRRCLTEALSLDDPDRTDAAHLLLMNITALSELRCGNHERAFELEKSIERTLEQQDPRDERLVFVNSLNLARLYRYVKDWTTSEIYYRRAFATADGSPSETDVVNEELCNARVQEDCERFAPAFHAVLRAAMYWMASDCPEALNWRVQGLLLGKDVLKSVTHLGEIHDLVERLSAAFQSTLVRLAAAAQLATPGDKACGPIRELRFLDESSSLLSAVEYVGCSEWSLLLVDQSKPLRSYGPCYEALRAYLNARLTQTIRRPVADRSIPGTFLGVGTFLIDRTDGRLMARTQAELLRQAVDANIPVSTYDGVKTCLNEEEMASLRGRRSGRRGPLVQRITATGQHLEMHFRRYLPLYRCTQEESLVFTTLQDEPLLEAAGRRVAAKGISSEIFTSALSSLRQRRIVQIEMAM